MKMSREQFRYIKLDGADKFKLHKLVGDSWIPYEHKEDGKLDYQDLGRTNIRFKGITDNAHRER